MDAFVKYFEDVSIKLGVLQTDIAKMIDAKKNKKEIMTKSIVPVTKVYKSREDIPKDKDIDYIIKAIDGVFKG